MAKINKEEAARRAGIAYAYKIALDKGIEGLKEEMQFRNITKAPLMVPREQVDDFCNEVKTNCVYTIKLMSALVLHDEFGFGEKRLLRYLERFDLKTECLADDYATWADFAEILEEECKLKFDIPDIFKEVTDEEH